MFTIMNVWEYRHLKKHADTEEQYHAEEYARDHNIGKVRDFRNHQDK